jgi:hypothetical protein
VATTEAWFPDVKQIWGRLQDAWHGEARQWTFGRLPDAHVLDRQELIADRAVEANEEYVGIRLRSMWIVNTRVGSTKFYPAYANLRRGVERELEVATAPVGLDEIELPILRAATTPSAETREVEPVAVDPPAR